MIEDATTASGIAPTVLQLALDVQGRIPAIAVTRRETRGGTVTEQHLRVSAGSARPNLSSLSGSVDEIIALDVLEHVRDEERWLAALADLAAPGATLRLRVPRQGPLTWTDGLNIYRYIEDITNRGSRPRETRPTGWHRSYTEAEAVRLVVEAGFRVDRVYRNGANLPEPPRLAALVLGDWVLERPGAERRARRLADRLFPIDVKIPAGPLSTRLEITATRR
jgi:hypothetical protein